MDLLLLRILGSDCRADVVEIVTEWQILERFFVDDAAENSFDASNSLERAITFLSTDK